MLYRLYQSWLHGLRMWWLTNEFVTYQSPMLLLQLLERQAKYHNAFCCHRVGLGDTVHLVDSQNSRPFQVTLVPDHRCDRSVGYIAVDSYLGSALFGRVEQDKLELIILGQRRSFTITQVTRKSNLSARADFTCGCLLCQ
ncbi:hypothetical protein CAG54_12915 [Vibrio sp. V27_P1S3P104]|uniref:GreA/GreB family elongation factor n=1 Tax=unclassified Vibrio TaxID=2614977 RepID=UPI0013737573|nr:MULTISPECIES: GreA/GreB family elongation factor [unclassified Vibrio]NAW69821.1 hypothetical protein [Vibrio sp. V28_P6S34P95]NAX03908.1 hypothetical protein [Vibrio sp. V30_P3S12P165]NAX33035.1 hypothetical protein [Vibrio sp. V29_P1S30P107]NAX38402.1 hypothetical protein [Vibrio sp. V27_P1S3P104]NAX40006.1 hypothetical protein [Vibrio sp. V26_P1S5P106]